MTEHTAAGHALGYVFQFDRATYHLLTASADVVAVGVEDVDDVTRHYSDGSLDREQLKSTIREQFQLSDSSVALWKTLAIWCEDLTKDSGLLEKTEYCFVLTGVVSPGSFASRLNSPTKDMAKDLRRLAKGVREDLQKYAAQVLKVRKELLAQLLAKIAVCDAQSSRFGGDLEQVQIFRIHQEQVVREAIFDRCSGWVRGKIRELAEARLPTKVTRREFDIELTAIAASIRSAPLNTLEPTPPTYAPASLFVQGFAKQLEWIKASEDEVHRAMCCYLHAQHARSVWAKGCAVSEAAFERYEADLVYKWSAEHSRVRRLSHHRSPEDAGYECYSQLIRAQTFLNAEAMSSAFSCGSLNTLADYSPDSRPRIGWHPDYIDLLGKPDESSP